VLARQHRAEKGLSGQQTPGRVRTNALVDKVAQAESICRGRNLGQYIFSVRSEDGEYLLLYPKKAFCKLSPYLLVSLWRDLEVVLLYKERG